jgi:hypothetical protein
MLMNDTYVIAQQIYDAMIMSLSPGERILMAGRMYDAAKSRMIAEIRSQMPDANEAQVRAQFFIQMHGSDFTPEELRKIMRELPNMQVDD